MSDAGNMKGDYHYAEMLRIMREQGSKDNPTTVLLGVMQSPNSVKIGDLVLYAEDLYIADYLVAGYTMSARIKESEQVTREVSFTYTDGLKKGDLVAVHKLHNNNLYIISERVVQAK